MIKKTFYISLFIFLSGNLFSINISTEQAYKISSSEYENKSIFIKDASLSNNTNAVLWTETNVPAQRWAFSKNIDDTYSITNVYSGKALYRKGAALEGASIIQSDNISSNASKWTLTAVENQNGFYYITQVHKNGNLKLYLETLTGDDGTTIRLSEKKNGNDAQKQIWKLELADVSSDIYQSLRKALMDGWKEKYYKKAASGYVLGDGGWWGDAEMLEVVLDAYETTGNPDYEKMFRELYKNFISRNKTDWLYNEYNDDIAWMVIASIRGYLLFGDQNYLTYAKTNFDKMYARALLPSGMLRWKETDETKNGTNSCINGPAEVAACYLGIALADESYYQKAKALYALQRKHLYVPATGKVYDCFTWKNNTPTNYNHWASTYNQGTYLGAAIMLYNHYGDKQYKEDAETIMQYTSKELCDENEIINVCQVGSGDLSGFKGILMRYVRRFIVDFQKTEYIDWMQKNTLHAFNNRNSLGVSSSAWLTKTPENFILNNCHEKCNFNNDPFGPSTAVSAAFNSPLNESLIIKDAFSNIQAENFNYLKGIHVQAGIEENQNEVTNIKDGFYVAYNNVNFSYNLASSIEIRVSKSAVKARIEIRLGGIDGDSIGTIDIPRDGDDWQIVSQKIRPITDLQNVYLLFQGVTNQNNLFKLDYFRFKSDIEMYSDITDNGGVLTSPIKTNSLKNATDNFLNTSVILQSTGDTYLQYESPIPVNLQAYALFSGDASPDKDIKSWKLQASNNNTDWIDLDVQNNQSFNTRYQKKNYQLSKNATFLFFRLNIMENNGNPNTTEFADFQLYGSSIFTKDITSDGGVLTAEFAGNETDEIVANLIDKSTSTKYLVENQSDLWVQYQAKGLYKLSSYSLTSANTLTGGDPRDWTLYASKDGINWDKIDQQQNQYFQYRHSTQYYFPKVNSGYRYFKLHITANNGAEITQLSEWQLLGNLHYDHFFNDITANGGELISSNNSTKEQLKSLIDNNGNTLYTQDASSLPLWIQYKSSIPSKLLGYSIIAGYNSENNPKNWILQGSNDGQTWENIHSRSNITFMGKGERKTYSINTIMSEYIYFRLYVTKLSNNSSTEILLGELELHGTGIKLTGDNTNNGGNIDAEYPDLNTSEGVAKLIDKSETTKYCTAFYGSTWVRYRFPTPKKITAYSITSANDAEKRDPRNWILEASNDGINWDLIDSRKKQKFLFRKETQYFSCNKELKEYSYFRLNITENNGAELVQFAEWQLLDIEGVEENTSEILPLPVYDFNFYPNPVQNVLFLDLPEPSYVYIFNLAGKVVFSEKLNAGLQNLRLSHLNEGFYLISTQTKNGLILKKILKN